MLLPRTFWLQRRFVQTRVGHDGSAMSKLNIDNLKKGIAGGSEPFPRDGRHMVVS